MVAPLKWTPKLISQFWDGLAETGILEEMSFAKLAGPVLLEFMLPWVPRDAKCLDFGGGSGHLVSLMCADGLRTASFEPSEQRGAIIRERLQGQASFLGTISSYDRQQYDFVVCTEVIEHIRIEDTDAYMHEMTGRIAPGGRLFLTTPFNENLAADKVYCPCCNHEFHRWQHQRSWQVSDIVALMKRWGLETEWIGLVGYNDPHPVRDFHLRKQLHEPWPWVLRDSDANSWPLVGIGDRITFIGRKPVEAPMSLQQPEKIGATGVAEASVMGGAPVVVVPSIMTPPDAPTVIVDYQMIAAGVAEASMMGGTPVVVVPSTMTPPDSPTVIVDDQLVARAMGTAVANGNSESRVTGGKATIVFPGPISLLVDAIEEGRVPSTPHALVFEEGTWRRTRPVPRVSPRKFRLSSGSGRIGQVIMRGIWQTNDRLREHLGVRRLQPYIDKRRDAVLATLLDPGRFPFRMSHFVENRVLFGIGGLYSGGAERQILNTIEGLRNRDVEDVHLLVEHLDEGSENAFYFERAKSVAASVVMSAERRHGTHPWALEHPDFRAVLSDGMINRILNAAETIKRLAPEVVQTSLDWTNITVGIAAVLAGVPHVIISGRNLGPQHFEFFQWFMYPCYQALAAHPSVHFLNNSEAGRDDYANWLRLPKNMIRTLRNGLHTDHFTPIDDGDRAKARLELGIDAATKVIVGAFRLSSEKRPLLWIDAAVRIKAKITDSVFLLCGVGKMKTEVEAHIRRVGLESSLRVLGSRSDIQTIFAAADLVMQTSLQEGTPNTLIEAQAMGVPVVTTPAFGAAEAVEDGVTGLVVRRETAAGLAAAAIFILHDAAFAASVRRAGPEFIKRQFGFERMVDETLAAYADAGAAWAVDFLPDPLKHKVWVPLVDAHQEHGHAWIKFVPELTALGDNSADPERSPLVVLEDGVPLGPPHVPHAIIRDKGEGAFSHWEGRLVFSSSDNSNILTNGRRYSAVVRRVFRRQ